MKHVKWVAGLLAGSLFWSLSAFGAVPGVYADRIVIGGVMDLEGHSRGLGQGMKAGVEAAIRGETVKGKRIEYVVVNDSYNPELTVKGVNELIQRGIFAMVGNVGTPTAKVALPILARNNVPAVGFFTGAGLLRPGVGDIINYRASYVQETAAVIREGLRSGLKASEICAFVQNDAYGMAGVEGIRQALARAPGSGPILETLDQILADETGQRNNVGPVGVYERNTLASRAGYDSLKAWEASQNTRCRLVVTVGAYSAVARFAGYARQKGEDWLISAVSFTGADNLRDTLARFSVRDRVVMTQVVPDIDSDLPIVRAAREALGDQFSYVSLEGYIVGRMFLAIANRIKGPLTPRAFVRAAQGSTFDLGGLKLDFTDDNQGSDQVTLTYFNHNRYDPMQVSLWQQLF
ncbi:MAG: branched-chain amino acid ABC transporter substrate-binding protein [Gammaproteobacteria bacterium]|nr:MAG: branched-chain amino acid ABC transporter substrate-binding protein [Gammaproteobacteria bacterium]